MVEPRRVVGREARFEKPPLIAAVALTVFANDETVRPFSLGVVARSRMPGAQRSHGQRVDLERSPRGSVEIGNPRRRSRDRVGRVRGPCGAERREGQDRS